jgi:hypothetical protein
MYELRQNSGNAFNNSFKEPEDKKPDFTGEHLNEDGKPMRLALWLKKTSKGDRFLGYVISEKQESQQKPKTTEIPFQDMADDIPF